MAVRALRGLHHSDNPLTGQPDLGKREQRLADGHIDMHGPSPMATGGNERLVDKSVTITPPVLIHRIGQAHRLCHKASQGVGLGQCLSVLLAYPRRGTVGRDRKSTRLNSSHANISYAVFCLKK